MHARPAAQPKSRRTVPGRTLVYSNTSLYKDRTDVSWPLPSPVLRARHSDACMPVEWLRAQSQLRRRRILRYPDAAALALEARVDGSRDAVAWFVRTGVLRRLE